LSEIPVHFPFQDIKLDVSSTAGFEITQEGAVKLIRLFSLKPLVIKTTQLV
jgi:hypothetical protein